MVKARLGGDASAEAWIIMICMGLGWGGESGQEYRVEAFDLTCRAYMLRTTLRRRTPEILPTPYLLQFILIRP